MVKCYSYGDEFPSLLVMEKKRWMDEYYLVIMFKEMKGNFKLVLKGHAVLDNKIEALSRNTAESFNEMNIKFEFLNEKIEQNTASVDALSDRVDSVEENLSARINEQVKIVNCLQELFSF